MYDHPLSEIRIKLKWRIDAMWQYLTLNNSGVKIKVMRQNKNRAVVIIHIINLALLFLFLFLLYSARASFITHEDATCGARVDDAAE